MSSSQFINLPTFKELMAKQDDEVVSPDGNICVRLANGTVKDICFRRNAYERYTESDLEYQLAQLAKLTFVARRRARQEALRVSLGLDQPLKKRQPLSQSEARLWEERKNTTVSTFSSHLTISVTGGIHWDIDIELGTLDELAEPQFLSELSQLIKETITEWRSSMFNLREKHLGPSDLVRAVFRKQR